MRLLMLPRYDAVGASSRLRMLQYVPALEARGIEVDVKPLLDGSYVPDLYAGRVSVSKVARSYVRRAWQLLHAKRYDAIWLEKEAWPWLPAVFENAWLPRTTRLVADYDDAVFHRYDQHPSALVQRVLGRKIDAVMRRADLVTAGNGYLAERANAAGARHVEWLPTVIDLNRYPPPREQTLPDSEPITVGWIGSPATAGYLRLLAPALETLAARQRIRCVAIGARPDQLEGTLFQACEWNENSEVAQLGLFDIGVMPLPDEPWEQGKCGYKLIQYMACGLPVVASPVGVNRDIVVPGDNGYLATTTEEWIEALERLVNQPELRRTMGVAGRRKVEQTYCLQVQAPRLAGMLRQVVEETVR
jgi:glycosyltransferase involved in cell wall biosynthesis